MTDRNASSQSYDSDKNIVDLDLPIETEPPSTASSTSVTTLTSAATQFPGATSAATEEATQQDKTIAIVLVVAILAIIFVFTLVYVLYQKRRHICGQSDAREKAAKPDPSAHEALITPLKVNGGGTESAPDGPLVSGPRVSRPRQAVPRKWYDSAAMKYMDQSTDTLDIV